jgi:hypothetical protein
LTHQLASDSVVPGSYSVTVKGRLPDGVYFTKLAMYSFQPDGTMREDFWLWQSNETGDVYGPSPITVGLTSPLDNVYPLNADSNTTIRVMLRFLDQDPTTLYGTWSLDGNTISIRWSWGDWELWRHTWSAPDRTLHKLELFGACYVQDSWYLFARGPDWLRNASAVNAGWAFGAPGVGFAQGSSTSEAGKKNYRGLISRFNAWCASSDEIVGDSKVGEDQMNLRLFQATTTGLLRYVQPATDCGCNVCTVFAYYAKPPLNASILARRMVYLIGHDFDCDGTLTEGGHTYSGLEIIDRTGTLRGFVLADCSDASGGCSDYHKHTISAMYYVDTYDYDCCYGVDPHTQEGDLTFTAVRRTIEGHVRLEIRAPVERIFEIERSDDLKTWMILTSGMSETGAPVQLTDDIAHGRAFYRALLQ